MAARKYSRRGLPRLDPDFRRSDELRIAAAVELYRRGFKPLMADKRGKTSATAAASAQIGGLLGAESVKKIYLRLRPKVSALPIPTLVSPRAGLERYVLDEQRPKILGRRPLYMDCNYMDKYERIFRRVEGAFVPAGDPPFENPRHYRHYMRNRLRLSR